VSIPLPGPGKGPIVRMNALPIVDLPTQCQTLSFRGEKDWRDLRTATNATEGQLIFTKADTVLCWGQETLIRSQFKDVSTIECHDLGDKIADIGRHLHVKGFLEEALCHALALGKPLLTRSTKSGSFLIADTHSEDHSPFAKLHQEVGKPFGQIAGILTPIDEEHPHPEKVHWAEALRVSIDFVDGRSWLILDPDIWIWPPRARRDAASFLDERRGDRYNNVYNSILDAWLAVLFREGDRQPVMNLSAFESGTDFENPSFSIGTRTAYTQRLAS